MPRTLTNTASVHQKQPPPSTMVDGLDEDSDMQRLPLNGQAPHPV
jgi:hypothetical protein